MENTVKLYTFSYKQVKTYPTVALFVLGNIVLPQLFHLIPQGGVTWLPIYFFTLIGAYKYGWQVGMLTALLSPLVNSLLFGMPAPAVVPAILLKSILLAAGAGFVANRFRRVSIGLLCLIVAFYQLFGTLGEWMLQGDFYLAVQDFRIGIPGMLLQVFGGYWFITHFIRK